jgi:hypothetical protein
MRISRMQISTGSATEATAVPDVIAIRASLILTKYLAIPRPASAGLFLDPLYRRLAVESAPRQPCYWAPKRRCR